MTKAELVSSIAKDAGVPKAAAEKALNSFTANVTKSLKKGVKVRRVRDIYRFQEGCQEG